MRPQRVSIVVVLAVSALLIGCGQVTGAQSSPGPVTLAVGATTYHPTEAISVTIANQGTSTIHFQDHRTQCTVIQLQIQAAGSWSTVFPCAVLTPTGMHSLASGKSQVVTLSAPRGGWQSGSYRAALPYSQGSVANAAGAATAYSAGFQVSA